MSNTNPNPLVVVVSHSHWDREWYLPFETFRFRLIQLVEQLLDILENDPEYRHFMLDGQTVLLEDIVELRPELGERLQHHIREGRISIGPWYVLQDEFLVSGESLARNLLLGRKTAKRFGPPMDVGYIPDAFGHVSQIPRILRGFGIDNAVLWRGIGDQIQNNEFRWKAPAGSEVLCLWLRWNYSSAERLPQDADAVHQKLRHDLDQMENKSRARVLLWMNGTDHQMPQPYLPALLRELSSREPDVEIAHSNLAHAVEAARERLDESTLEVLQNELRRTGPGVGFLLPGVFSARTWQQREHDRAQWRLVREAEPFATWADLPRRGPLEHVWKMLLKCQPHDSICGCSVDNVHREIDVRQEKVHQLATALFEEGIRAIAEDPVHTPGMIRNDPHPDALALANAHPFEIDALIEKRFHRPADRMPFRLMGPDGEVPYTLVANENADSTLPDAHPKREWMRQVDIRILAKRLPPLGVQNLRIEEGNPTAKAQGLQINDDRVDNGLLAIAPCPGGIAITDLETGTLVSHRFEDQADQGDEYNFTPLLDETPLHPKDACYHAEVDESSASLRAEFQWTLPTSLNEERTCREGEAELGMVLTARLFPGSRAVSFALEIDNRSRDHRLRARFDLGESQPHFWTDSPFDWVQRDAGEPPPAPDSQELPVAQHPMSSMAAVSLSTAHVGIGSVGLREVELDKRGRFFLTILRSVGWLSRGDLHNRLREAGPNLSTPGAQGIGPHLFRYALCFDDLKQAVSVVHRSLEPLLFPPSVVELTRTRIDQQAFVEVSPPSVRLAAIKRAEDDDRIIVRLVGPSDGDKVKAELRVWNEVKEARHSDLDERVGTPLPVNRDGNESVIPIDLTARNVETISLRMG